MIPATKKWLFLKVSSLILLPLMFWFIINLVNIYDKNHQDIVEFLTSQPSKFLISLFLVFAYFFSALSISEVFEDYIQDEKIKNAANKALNFFAIIIPIITIFVIFNLNT
jgi:succinate dehydrogenase / fumarate reductase membrane anchor subunit|tara:strand:+ start:260 stop:589 length:330 start_codon:yes stop_codon:yes gene_type:complete